jgi:tetratricopeptide (TPR) repeat protein
MSMTTCAPKASESARLLAASFIVLLALSAFCGARTPQTQQQPLTRDNLVTLLQTKALTNEELIQIIRRRGVDFALTTENETTLARAGASMDVLYAVSQNYHAGSQAGGDTLSRPSGPVYQQGSASDFFARGEQYLNANQPGEALEAFQQVMRLAPDSPAGYLGAGLAYGRMKQNEEAVEALQHGLRLKPDMPDAYLYLGFSQLALHRDEEALATFRQSLRYNANNALAQVGVGQAYSDMEQFEQAVAAMEQATRLKPDFAEAFSALSAAYGNAGRYDDALAASRRAVQLKPDLVEGYINLSYSYGNLGRYQEALDAATQAVRLNPQDPEAASYAYGNLSYAYIRLSQLPEALDAARRAVAAKPDAAVMYANLGYVQNELGQYQEAMASAQQALRLKAKPKETGQAYYVLGYALAKLNQRPKALEAFRQSVANYNQVAHPDADDTFYMGNSYLQLGEDQPAAEAFQRAIRMRPNFSLPRYSLGLLYYTMRNQRGAMEQYQILKTLDPRRAAQLLIVINKR